MTCAPRPGRDPGTLHGDRPPSRPQLHAAKLLLSDSPARPRRLVVACHYPLAAPAIYERDLHHKRLINAVEVGVLAGVDRPAPVLLRPRPRGLGLRAAFDSGSALPQRCVPLLRDPTGLRPPGFLEITLHDRDVSVIHHAGCGEEWETRGRSKIQSSSRQQPAESIVYARAVGKV